ncbi:MAG: hypothetical protein A3C53_04965 [Omnitrophica WOR_2 bacterium RIFCSPHIGHO2_02_FULL_68_15]|nr:MAG: hypothetical protein A3C53_04965 [Omnitrophica WOR_2 bacterium RIFCSPHIGHO2_02_FULL_68_15]
MRRRVLLFALAAALTLGPTRVFSQMSNRLYVLTQETVASSGGTIGGGNPMRAQTALGLPAAGRASNGVFTLIGGLGVMPRASLPAGATITVTGTVDDPSATVTVYAIGGSASGGNGVAATVSGGTFTANNVVLSFGPNTITAVATDGLGNSATYSIHVILDLPAERKTERFSIIVTGTINEASATVSVNRVDADIDNGQFSASVPLTSGLNTLTALATDAGRNTASASIRVFVPPPTTVPARPTVGTAGDPIPAVTTAGSLTIGGTKTAGTSIWINGVQAGALNNELTWTKLVSLVEGDNEFVIVAKDAAGTPSAAVRVVVVVDNAPPVVTFSPPARTNLNPVTLTGEVDDHLTTVTINDIPATRAGRSFQVSVPLNPGLTPIVLVARSPNGYTTTKSGGITLGAIPIITSTDPADRAKVFAGQALTIRTTATDQEADPLQYRVLLDGALLVDWSGSNTAPWTPPTGQFGPRVLTVAVRDGFGGERTQDVRVFVIRKPVDHP